jgi:cold shock CspA family protein
MTDISEDDTVPEAIDTEMEQLPVLPEVTDVEKGTYIGQCKWFNDKLGYGFITICDGDKKGKDIFVHHSGIKPQNSNYKTLRKGEYINFNIITGVNGLQAVDITGINGGPLMCDVIQGFIPQPPMRQQMIPQQQQPGGWQTVPQKRSYARVASPGMIQPPPPPPPRNIEGYQKRVPVKNTNKYNKETRNKPMNV